MHRLWKHIQTFFQHIYSRIFRSVSFLDPHKKIIADIIKKYQNVNYEEKVGAEESMSYYTRWLIAWLLESKTFNFIFVSYLKTFVYPTTLRNIQQAHTIQKNMLTYILKEIRYTEFAKNYGLESGTKDDYQDFISKVPVATYEEFKPRIERSKSERDILRPGKITKFSASAWTTSRKKHIPVTDQALESASKAWLDMLATYVIKHPTTEIFSGYYRPLVGTIQEQFEDGSIVSDVSALLALDRSGVLQAKYKYDLEVLLEPNWYIKRDLFAKKLHPKEKTIMLGVTSWINEMLHYLQEKDTKKFQTFVKNLSLIVRGWVSAKPYIKYFNELGVDHIGVYNASEWYLGYQDIVNYKNDQAQAPYQLLVNHGIFYEFIPFTVDNFDQWIVRQDAEIKPLRAIQSADISSSTKFALVITTNAGLFRYLIGDVIRFVDEDYRFEIVGRTKECINLKGEELMEDHVNIALQKIGEIYKTDFANYTIGPDHECDPQAHEWVLEGELPWGLSLEALTNKIDNLLQEANADYEAKRKNDMLLKMPIIHLVAPGTFHQWLEKHKKLWGQAKVPKLSTERKILEELLS